MDRGINPYRPGAGNQPPALIGRDALIDGFGVAIRRTMAHQPGKSVIPIGLRGVGKTVLLNRFTQIAADAGMQTDFIEAPETGHFPTLLATHLRRLLLDMTRSGVKDAARRALRVLKAFTLQLPDGSTIKLDVDALTGHGDSGVLQDDVTDLMVAVGEAALEYDTGLCVAIDEVQYLAREELGALIAAIHRTTQLDLPVMLVGAGLPQLPGLAGEAKSYAERLFDFPEIGSLDALEAADALAIPAKEAGVAYEKDALDRIVAEADGYPYFLQEWGYHVWETAEHDPIDLDDVARAHGRVVDQLDQNFFQVRFGRLTPKEKEYLRAMAALGPGPHRSGDIASALGVKVESVAPRRSQLISKGMVYSPAHGDTAFTVPLFDKFLKRVMPDREHSG